MFRLKKLKHIYLAPINNASCVHGWNLASLPGKYIGVLFPPKSRLPAHSLLWQHGTSMKGEVVFCGIAGSNGMKLNQLAAE